MEDLKGEGMPPTYHQNERSISVNQEIGTPCDCPACRNEKVAVKKCRVCQGNGRVEYQKTDGPMRAPAGSWLPTNYRGKTGYLIVLFGNAIQYKTRG